jgi:NAD(P)H-flavin reductase
MNRKETGDTRTIELESAGADSVPAWLPGQFMMLYAFGAGEIPISISGDPARRNTIVHTVRAVGSISRTICKAKPGSSIGVRGPFGSAWPAEQYHGHDVVLVAGGLGLAPLRPLVYTIMSDRRRYGRVILFVAARAPQIILYRTEMERWRKHDIDLRLTVDAAQPGWQESVGPVTALIPRIELDASRAAAFIVGPEIMMRVVARTLAERGVLPDRLFISMERNMKCAVAFCGHCQLGPAFICKDGPIFPWSRVEPWLRIRNL